MSLLWPRCSWTHFYPYPFKWQMLRSEGHWPQNRGRDREVEARLTSMFWGFQAHQPLTTHHTGLELNGPELALKCWGDPHLFYPSYNIRITKYFLWEYIFRSSSWVSGCKLWVYEISIFLKGSFTGYVNVIFLRTFGSYIVAKENNGISAVCIPS